METFDDETFRSVINNSDLVVPDGQPLVWAQKLLGHHYAEQVRGTDLTMLVCEMAEQEQIPIGFFGATSELHNQLKRVLLVKFPRLNIVYFKAPPFRPASKKEITQYIEEINSSGLEVLFVGLGCPKQENWMSEQKVKLSCTMIGVGAAFDFIAGNKKHAPKWLQRAGLEWMFRLIAEPKRLWKRYLKHNPRFIYYFLRQLMGKSFH